MFELLGDYDIAVPFDGQHRRDLLEPLEDMLSVDIAGVEDQVHLGKGAHDLLRQLFYEQVGVGDKADAHLGHAQLDDQVPAQVSQHLLRV